jgi:hypothetical protein
VTLGHYSLKSPSYSFAMIFFEMLTLSKPFATFHPGQHLVKVCIQGKRPNLAIYQFPIALENLLTGAWKHSLHKRLSIPTMAQVLDTLPFHTTTTTPTPSPSNQHPGRDQPQQSKQQETRTEPTTMSHLSNNDDDDVNEHEHDDGSSGQQPQQRRQQQRTRRRTSTSLSPRHVGGNRPTLGNAHHIITTRPHSDRALYKMVSPLARMVSPLARKKQTIQLQEGLPHLKTLDL